MREAASAAYQTALAGARARAQSLAEENRQTLNAEIAKAKADAEAEAHKAMAAADARINATRVAAKEHVIQAARRSRHRHRGAADGRDGFCRRRRPRGRGGLIMELLHEPEFWVARRLRPGDRHSGLEGRAQDGRQDAGQPRRRHRRRTGGSPPPARGSRRPARRLQGQGRRRRSAKPKPSSPKRAPKPPASPKSPAPISRPRSNAAPRRRRTRSPRPKPPR